LRSATALARSLFEEQAADPPAREVFAVIGGALVELVGEIHLELRTRGAAALHLHDFHAAADGVFFVIGIAGDARIVKPDRGAAFVAGDLLEIEEEAVATRRAGDDGPVPGRELLVVALIDAEVVEARPVLDGDVAIDIAAVVAGVTETAKIIAGERGRADLGGEGGKSKEGEPKETRNYNRVGECGSPETSRPLIRRASMASAARSGHLSGRKIRRNAGR
jgi:hypothetical protein